MLLDDIEGVSAVGNCWFVLGGGSCVVLWVSSIGGVVEWARDGALDTAGEATIEVFGSGVASLDIEFDALACPELGPWGVDRERRRVESLFLTRPVVFSGVPSDLGDDGELELDWEGAESEGEVCVPLASPGRELATSVVWTMPCTTTSVPGGGNGRVPGCVGNCSCAGAMESGSPDSLLIGANAGRSRSAYPGSSSGHCGSIPSPSGCESLYKASGAV